MGVLRRAALVAAPQLVLLALSASAAASAPCATDSIQPTVATADDAAAAIVCDLNVVRAQHGLAQLGWDGRLASAAQGMADDMAARHYASHVTPDGVDMTARVERTGYIPSNATWSLAENLGWGTNVYSTPLATVNGWMASQAHRDNVLDGDLRDVGVGVAQGAVSPGGPVGTIYVADFGVRGTATATVHHRRAHARRSRHTRRHARRHHRRR
jgi:uncharacterized protein YkwD